VAFSQPISECKIQASSFQQISIGFPVNPERLAKIVNPNNKIVNINKKV
jgi:hypothetical protein